MFNDENTSSTCGDQENIRRAINKIKHDSKFKPVCCVGPVGPTGPTGPQGPSTIDVGTTTTGAPGTTATVTNSGTNTNVVLDFVIPSGATGPTGPASTIDSILVGYDGIQEVATNTSLDLGTLINSTGASLDFTAPNTITINEEGTYLINFSSIIYNTNTAGDLGVSLRINGTIVPTASEYIATQTSAFSSELQHNYNAQVGDTITLVNQSTVSNSYHDVTLSIIRLV